MSTPQTPTPETDAAIQKETYYPYDSQEPRELEYVEPNIARKLERERDEARQRGDEEMLRLKLVEHILDEEFTDVHTQLCPTAQSAVRVMAELTQLRKVCDELVAGVNEYAGENKRGNPKAVKLLAALTNYSTLPHVKAKGTTK